MAISRINPTAASSGGGVSTQFLTLPNSNRYVASLDLASGTYSIAGTATHASGTVDFLDSGNSIITTATFSGVIPTVVSIATPVKKVRAYANPYRSDGRTEMGSIQVGITLTGLTALSNSYSGTVTTYTSSQAVSINGTAYVIAVGGGGGGNSSNSGSYYGSGGGSGAVIEKFATNWSGAYTLTIGSGGSGVNASGTGQQPSGGSTILANAGGTLFTAGGGLTGNYGPNGGGGGSYGAPSGTYDYAGGSNGGRGYNNGGSGNGDMTTAIYPTKYQWAKAFAVVGGAGGGGSAQTALNNGTGGASAGNATGYGNGGGGANGGTGGNGSSGVLYVITGLQEY